MRYTRTINEVNQQREKLILQGKTVLLRKKHELRQVKAPYRSAKELTNLEKEEKRIWC
jgi:hypothetical protein